MRTVLIVCVLAAVASAQRTFLVNEGPTGAPPPEGAGIADVSHDGRYVVFDSAASIFIAGDLNGVSGVYLRDLQTGLYELISRSASGPGTLASSSAIMTPDARYVAFVSASQNLATPNDVGTFDDVFVRDRQLGTTIKVSVMPGGGEANNSSRWPGISNDGSRVCFSSQAANLSPVDPYAYEDVFVRDLSLGTTTLVSATPGGWVGNDHSYVATISGDGRFVAFSSDASDLIAGDTNGVGDIFVRDLQSQTTVRASVATGGAQADNYSHMAALSDDGRIVAFHSVATNLATPDVPPWQDIFVRDMQSGVTTRVSQSASGTPANYSSWSPSLSGDGRYVAFTTYAYNLLPSAHRHAIVRVDRATGEVIETQGSVCGVPVDQVGLPRISGDGSKVVFPCKAAHAASRDTNNKYDVFLHDTNAPAVPKVCTYCAVAPTSHGCLPAISATGAPSATAGAGFVLNVSSVEGQRTAMFLFSPYSVSVPWGGAGHSFRCVDTFWGRFGHQNSGGTSNQCDGALVVDANAWWSSNGAVSAGHEAFVQAWFRDPASNAGSHFSEALSCVVRP